MIVYGESNFVLEIALGQEFHQPAEDIVRLAEERQLELVFPSFALAEPFTTLEHRARERTRLYGSLTGQLKQISRSIPHQEDLLTLQPLLPILAQITLREDELLATVMVRLLTVGRLVSMNRHNFLLSRELRQRVGLSAPDAIILATVLGDLERQVPTDQKWFFNRNWKDFSDPWIIDQLHRHNCRYVENFADGLFEIQAARELDR